MLGLFPFFFVCYCINFYSNQQSPQVFQMRCSKTITSQKVPPFPSFLQTPKQPMFRLSRVSFCPQRTPKGVMLTAALTSLFSDDISYNFLVVHLPSQHFYKPLKQSLDQPEFHFVPRELPRELCSLPHSTHFSVIIYHISSKLCISLHYICTNRHFFQVN